MWPTPSLTLHKLNDDTTWLLSLPLPESPHRFTLLLDPWLSPAAQTDLHPLFSRQTRLRPAQFSSIAAVQHHLSAATDNPRPNRLGALLLSHPFSDHAHPETLLEALRADDPSDLVIIATVEAAESVVPLLPSPNPSQAAVPPSRTVHLLRLPPDGTVLHHALLPPHLHLRHLRATERLRSPSWSPLHGGIHLSLATASGTAPHQLLYTPHGIAPSSLPAALHPHPACKAHRILLHSFDTQTLPLLGTVASGLPNIEALDRVWRPTHVLATHDERKEAHGLVARLLARRRWSESEVREALRSTRNHEGEEAQEVVVRCLQVGEVLDIPL